MEKYDKRAYHLSRAADIWQESLTADIKTRAAFIPELHRMELFSNRQIAKICRVGTHTVNRTGAKTSVGGRFNPESLSALVFLREAHVRREQLPFTVIRTIVQEGTSLSNLCRMVGCRSVTFYKKLKEEQCA